MTERNINGKPEKGDAKEKAEEKTDKMKNRLGKLGNPLVVGILTAGLAAGCSTLNARGNRGIELDVRTEDGSTRLETIGGDADEDEMEADVPGEVEDVTDVLDAPDEDVVEDVTDAVEDVVEEEVSEDVEEDAAADVVEEDVAEEDVAEEDVTSEDVMGEDVTVVCTPFDDSRTVTMGTDIPMTVGGVDVVYRGLDTSGDPTYDIYCGVVPVRTGIVVAVGGSETVDVSEHRFRITLSPSSARPWSTSVNVSVDAY